MSSVYLFSILTIAKATYLTLSYDSNCITSNKIFNFAATEVTVIYHANLSGCANEVLLQIGSAMKTVDVVTLKDEKMAFSNQNLKISKHHTVFLFFNSDDIQKFINEYFVVAHSSSVVFLIVVKNCEDFEILSVWWTRFKILRVLAYCSITNELFSYNPLNSSTLQWNLENVSDLDAIFVKTTDLDGYPLKIYIFDRIPTAVSLENIPKTLSESVTYKRLLKVVPFAGVDSFIIAELSHFLNFTPMLVLDPKERLAYGQVFENGSGIGLLGSVATGVADIAGNGLYLKDYHTDQLDFLVPHNGINLCFIVPKASAIPSWKLVFSCFTKISWISLFSILLLLSILWDIFERLVQEKHYGVFYLLQLFLSTPSRNSPALNSKRLLILTCLFFNIILTSVFQGNLVTSYTKTVFYKDLDTLEEIDEAGLLVSTCITDIFGHNLTGARKNLYNKIVKTMSERSINRVAYKRDCCAVERKADAEFNIESMYVSEDGTPLLHITDICDLSYSVVFAIVKGFPFAATFNGIITKLIEAGFTEKWNEDVTYSITVQNRFKRNERSNSVKAIGIKETQAAFYILGSGLVLGFLIFLVEVL